MFSTKDRVPFLRDRALRDELHTYLGGTCRKLKSPSLIVGGVADHVHILCRFGRTITTADLLLGLKKESSKWTNAMCGIDGALLTERLDIQPLQGWGMGMPSTQGGASLTLGFKIEPPWGSRSEPCRNSEMKRGAHIKAATQPSATHLVRLSKAALRSWQRDFDEALTLTNPAISAKWVPPT